MINFFRKIRQNLIAESKMGIYMKYAIGEIILVMVGILLALQVNNWNEKRKEVLHEKSVLTNLVEDLRADSASFQENHVDLIEVDLVHQQLYDVIAQRSNGDGLENPQTIRRLIWYNPIAKENDPFIANKISNEPIRREIQKYYRAMNDMDHIYEEFSTITKLQMRPYLGEKELYDIHSHFDNDSSTTSWLKKEGLIQVSMNPDFQQILFECNVKLREVKGKLQVLMEQNEILKGKITSGLIDYQ